MSFLRNTPQHLFQIQPRKIIGNEENLESRARSHGKHWMRKPL